MNDRLTISPMSAERCQSTDCIRQDLTDLQKQIALTLDVMRRGNADAPNSLKD